MSSRSKKSSNEFKNKKDLIKSIISRVPRKKFLSDSQEEYYNRLQQFTFCKPTDLFEMVYYYYLNPKTLLVQKRFHKAALTLLLDNVILRYKQSMVHPGEMVGVIAEVSS